MKKLLLYLIVASLFSFVLTACSSSGNPTSPKNPTNPTNPTDPNSPSESGDPSNPTDPTEPTNPSPSETVVETLLKDINLSTTMNVCQTGSSGNNQQIPFLQNASGTIIYDAQGSSQIEREIRCASPDGTKDESLYSLTGNIRGLEWQKDHKAIAFSSNHEQLYSFQDSDIFVLAPKSNASALETAASDLALTRLTSGPRHEAIKAISSGKGTVTVQITNNAPAGSSAVNVYVHVLGYVGGALPSLSIAAGATESVTVADVVDFGDEIFQYVSVRYVSTPSTVWYSDAYLVDVEENETVSLTVPVGIGNPGTVASPASSGQPSWTQDGQIMFDIANDIRTIDTTNRTAIVDLGNEAHSFALNSSLFSAKANPVNNSVLYVTSSTIGVIDSNGQKQDYINCLGVCFDAAWMPNGTSFLYWDTNLYMADLTSLTQLPLVTDSQGGVVHHAAPSPDGQFVVFSFSRSGGNMSLYAVDLRDMNNLQVALFQESTNIGAIDWR